jgi:hypothetical protein
MTELELEAARGFWSRFKDWMQTESSKRELRYEEMSLDGINVSPRDGRGVRVRFEPADDRRQLNYELPDGTLKELQFVLAEKAYFRHEGVNYSAERLGQKMLEELQASR